MVYEVSLQTKGLFLEKNEVRIRETLKNKKLSGTTSLSNIRLNVTYYITLYK